MSLEKKDIPKRRARKRARKTEQVPTYDLRQLATLLPFRPPRMPEKALDPEKKGSREALGADWVIDIKEEKKSKEEEIPPSIHGLLGAFGKLGGKPWKAAFRLNVGTQVAVNSAANRYKQFVYGGGTTFNWSALAQAAEFSTLDALFDEFFIKSIKFTFIPRNKFSANNTAAVTGTPAGAPGECNTCAATLYYLPHNSPTFADASSSWYAAANAHSAKMVDLGSPFEFVMKNPERFDWAGPLGDQTTATSTMSWCQFSQAAKYGGVCELLTPVASGAAVGIGVLLENGVFGDMMVSFNIAVRARA